MLKTAGGTPETAASTAGNSLPAGGTPETAASTAESSLPAGGTEAEAPQMDGSWLLENAHARDDMSDMETVQSFEIVEEPEV